MLRHQLHQRRFNHSQNRSKQSPAMAAKRLNVTKVESKSGPIKIPRMEHGVNGAPLIAVARRWGNALWVFEGD